MEPGLELTPDYPIHTHRLLLRPIELSDVDDMVSYRGRPDVCRYLPFEPQTAQSLRPRLEPTLRRDLTAEGQVLTLGMVVRATGRLIGDIILFYRSELDRSGEIGYVIHPDAAGRGYATEAAEAVLRLAFQEMGMHRVEARLDARNDRSAALLERLGMRREAHFVEKEWFKGEWSDLLVYGLLRREWTARNARPA